jgi:predicted nucleic acid-binding Zn ribbon protein
MLKRSSQPERIDRVLSRTLRNLRIDHRIKQESVLLNWNRVVGDTIAARTNPLRVKDCVLFVRVENPSWRNELVFVKPKIIRELNQSVKANVVRDIVFTN